MSLDLSNPEYSRAIELYLSGDRNEAKRAIQELLRSRKDDHCLLLLLADTVYSLGHLSEAIDYYKKALEIKPDIGNAYYRLGVCYYRAGRLKEGLQAFTRVLELGDQSHAMASYYVGLINYLLGNYSAAVDSFSNLREVSPESLISNFYLSQLKMRQHDFDEALELLKQLEAVTPDVAEVYYLLGTVHFRLHNTNDAMKSYRRTLELNPNDVRARSVIELMVDS